MRLTLAILPRYFVALWIESHLGCISAPCSCEVGSIDSKESGPIRTNSFHTANFASHLIRRSYKALALQAASI
jgi:hypothetical protein